MKSEFDELFTITCGKCGLTNPLTDWTNDVAGMRLPNGCFRCPDCGFLFERKRKINRKPWDKFVEVEVVPT